MNAGIRAAFRCLSAAVAAWSMTAAAAPSDQLHDLIAGYDAYSQHEDPIAAGQRGDIDALSRWPDDSRAADEARAATLREFKAKLAAIPATGLDAEDAIDRGFLARLIDQQLDSIGFDEGRLAFQADDGFFNTPDYVARGTVIRTRAEADAFLARLEAIPAYFATATANAGRGLGTGFTQPEIVAEAALGSARAQAAIPADKSSLILPLAHLPDIFPADEQAALRARALDIVTTRVIPAERAFVTFLEAKYLPGTRKSVGFGAVPGGPAYYAYTVRHHTTTDLTPDQVHEIGLKEVARIRGEMDKVIAESGFKGSFGEFQTFLRTDKRFYVTSRQALLEKASEIAKRIDDQLPRWFGLLPRLTYGVRPVPEAIEESYTSARYWPGSPEQGTAGGFMVNTSHLDQRPLYELPALALHEAVPGHHLQIAIGLENQAIPKFRRDADLTAFVEGWAVYSEKLGLEMGIYRDPYERFGQLSMEMWRACRLVVDTGLHAKGWTRDQAIAYLGSNTALSPKNVEVEVDRYIGWPGQALGYKIGQIKISELRSRAEAGLGSRFDIRAFHDFVLDDGPLPLDLLEQRVDDWIARRKS
jgi:uncharacterized protein (DUF885 family)